MHAWARWNWTRVALLVWGVLLLGIALYSFFHPDSHTVYNIYAPAARRWWYGENIYVRLIDYYRYSPLFAVVLSPLAMLPDGWGNALWKVLNGLALAGALGVWARRLLPGPLSRGQHAGLFLLALPLALHSMYIGQANVLMLAALLAGMAAAAEDRWNLCAACLAAATLIKGYPLALALVLAGLYPRQFPLRFGAALAVGLLLPFATYDPAVVAAQYASWVSHLADSTCIMRERLRSLDYLFVLAGKPLSSRAFALVELAAGALVFGLSWLRTRQTADPRERLLRVWLLFSVWVVLFGPATETCTYVVAAPSIAWALVEAYRRPAGRLTRLLLIASLVLMEPLVSDLAGPLRNFAVEHGSQPVGGLLFLMYLLLQSGTPASRQAAPANASPEGTPLAAAA